MLPETPPSPSVAILASIRDKPVDNRDRGCSDKDWCPVVSRIFQRSESKKLVISSLVRSSTVLQPAPIKSIVFSNADAKSAAMRPDGTSSGTLFSFSADKQFKYKVGGIKPDGYNCMLYPVDVDIELASGLTFGRRFYYSSSQQVSGHVRFNGDNMERLSIARDKPDDRPSSGRNRTPQANSPSPSPALSQLHARESQYGSSNPGPASAFSMDWAGYDTPSDVPCPAPVSPWASNLDPIVTAADISVPLDQRSEACSSIHPSSDASSLSFVPSHSAPSGVFPAYLSNVGQASEPPPAPRPVESKQFVPTESDVLIRCQTSDTRFHTVSAIVTPGEGVNVEFSINMDQIDNPRFRRGFRFAVEAKSPHPAQPNLEMRSGPVALMAHWIDPAQGRVRIGIPLSMFQDLMATEDVTDPSPGNWWIMMFQISIAYFKNPVGFVRGYINVGRDPLPLNTNGPSGPGAPGGGGGSSSSGYQPFSGLSFSNTGVVLHISFPLDFPGEGPTQQVREALQEIISALSRSQQPTAVRLLQRVRSGCRDAMILIPLMFEAAFEMPNPTSLLLSKAPAEVWHEIAAISQSKTLEKKLVTLGIKQSSPRSSSVRSESSPSVSRTKQPSSRSEANGITSVPTETTGTFAIIVNDKQPPPPLKRSRCVPKGCSLAHAVFWSGFLVFVAASLLALSFSIQDMLHSTPTVLPGQPTNITCGDGMVPYANNSMCVCRPGYYEVETICVPCDGYNWTVIAGVSVFCVFVVAFFYAQTAREDSGEADPTSVKLSTITLIFSYFVQTSSLIFSQNLTVVSFFSVFDFNWSFWEARSPTCIAPLNPFERLKMLFLPIFYLSGALLLLLLIQLVAHFLYRLIFHLREKRTNLGANPGAVFGLPELDDTACSRCLTGMQRCCDRPTQINCKLISRLFCCVRPQQLVNCWTRLTGACHQRLAARRPNCPLVDHGPIKKLLYYVFALGHLTFVEQTRRVVETMALIYVFTFSAMLRATFSFLDCTTNYLGDQVVRSYPAVYCESGPYAEEYQRWKPIAILILTFEISVPILFSFSIFFTRTERTGTSSLDLENQLPLPKRTKFAFLNSKYDQSNRLARYWEPFILYRRASLVAIAVFFADPDARHLRQGLSACLCFAFFLFHTSTHPFTWTSGNQLESCSLASLTFLTSYFIAFGQHIPNNRGLAIVSTIFVCLPIAIICAAVWISSKPDDEGAEAKKEREDEQRTCAEYRGKANITRKKRRFEVPPTESLGIKPSQSSKVYVQRDLSAGAQAPPSPTLTRSFSLESLRSGLTPSLSSATLHLSDVSGDTESLSSSRKLPKVPGLASVPSLSRVPPKRLLSHPQSTQRSTVSTSRSGVGEIELPSMSEWDRPSSQLSTSISEEGPSLHKARISLRRLRPSAPSKLSEPRTSSAPPPMPYIQDPFNLDEAIVRLDLGVMAPKDMTPIPGPVRRTKTQAPRKRR